jgi:threonine/homoserine/homoserine lactone efflux protein
MWEIPGIRELPVFLVSAAMLAVTPGQDTLYVMGRALAQGRKAGIISVAGILSGALIHLFAGAVGLSALLAASPSAFTVVKWAGGAYLIYLGVRMLVGGGKDEEVETRSITSSAELWRQGFITNVLNPKVALFCLAFIPQFIAPGTSNTVPVFLILGLCFFVIGGLWLLLVVAFAAAIGGKFSGDWNVALNRVVGVLFIGLGLRLLFQHL